MINQILMQVAKLLDSYSKIYTIFFEIIQITFIAFLFLTTQNIFFNLFLLLSVFVFLFQLYISAKFNKTQYFDIYNCFIKKNIFILKENNKSVILKTIIIINNILFIFDLLIYVGLKFYG